MAILAANEAFQVASRHEDMPDRHYGDGSEQGCSHHLEDL